MSPILEAKAVKNDVELEGMRRAYLRDGRATVRCVRGDNESAITSADQLRSTGGSPNWIGGSGRTMSRSTSGPPGSSLLVWACPFRFTDELTLSERCSPSFARRNCTSAGWPTYVSPFSTLK
jgi:hypothetical protein